MAVAGALFELSWRLVKLTDKEVLRMKKLVILCTVIVVALLPIASIIGCHHQAVAAGLTYPASPNPILQQRDPILLAPAPGATNVILSPSFGWAPVYGAELYEFVLARNAALTDVVATAEVPTTVFQYEGTLARATNYFWGVRVTKPEPGPQIIAFFTTMVEPSPSPNVIVTFPEAETPAYIWAIIVADIISLTIAIAIVILVIILLRRQKRQNVGGDLPPIISSLF